MKGVTESSETREVRQRYEVPSGIELRVGPRDVLAWVPGFETAVREVAAHPDDLPLSRLGGRRPLKRVDTGGGHWLLVREYRKGGYFTRLRAPRMTGSWRPLTELSLHRRLRALGVPVADAVGCVILRLTVGWRGFLLLEEVPGARDLEAILYGLDVPGGQSRREVLRKAGEAVRLLHDAGLPHPDLHPKNLLVTADGRILLLDLDKAMVPEGRLGESERLGNLVRLGRAIEKHRLKGLEVGRRDALRFLEGYAGSREAAGLWLDQIRARLRRGLGVRIVWWHLMGQARPWRPPDQVDA